MKHSHWQDFVKDLGDCVGGLLVGYAIAERELATGIVGMFCILASLFFKHYYKPKV